MTQPTKSNQEDLPDFEELGKIKEQKKLRAPKKPDSGKLIGQQKEAYEKLINFAHSGREMFCFEGFAGVGKSFCINMFIEEMISSHRSHICACAPTHKAKVVLQQMAEFHSEEYLHYSTIHAILGLKPIITENGEETFVKDKFVENSFGDYDYVIIDESSMIEDKIFGYLLEEQNKNVDTKIIFVGDHKQLPPVKQTCSAPMHPKVRKRFEIEHALLTQIVRQKDGNPIIKLSKEIREGKFKPTNNFNDDGHGVLVVKRDGYKGLLKRLFTSGEYEKNPNYCRVVAWRNSCVVEFNNKIRRMIYDQKIIDMKKNLEEEGLEPKEILKVLKEKFPFYKNGKLHLPKYVVGDKLIADKPIFHSETNSIIFQTNEELIITGIGIDHKIGLGEFYKCYVVTVKNIWTGKYEEIEMIHEDSEIDYNKHLERLKDEALKVNKANPRKRVAAWKLYYSLEKRFARCKYAPCLTTYKAQGSTYENIVIMYPDIKENPKKQELLQHLYVGVTRASKRVFVLV